MRHKNPETMQKIIQIVEELRMEKCINPSISMIAERVGMSKSTTHAYLMEMNEKGLIDYEKKNIQTERTRLVSDGRNAIPIVGSIRCGEPAEEFEDVQEYVQLPTSIFGNGVMYILKASGDSMVDAGIDEGDLVVIAKDAVPEINDIVVALTDDGENTLKKLSDKTGNGKVVLEYENREKYPAKTITLDGVRIQGVAKFIIKKL